jgi:dihydroorotase-like cyclic amidohydrolase
VENGLLLVQFGAITLREFAIKASLNGARALGLPNKGHLAAGADADVSILDFDRKKAYATIVNGKVIMKDGALLGSGTGIICDKRGEAYLKSRGIRTIVKGDLCPENIEKRFVP